MPVMSQDIGVWLAWWYFHHTLISSTRHTTHMTNTRMVTTA